MKTRIALIAVALVLMVGSSGNSDVSSRSIDLVISRMSDEEKIAQLLFVGYSGQVNSDELRLLCGTWRVGGIVLYAHNIESPEQVKRLTEAIISDAGGGTVPFIAIDQEGGIVHRLGQSAVIVPSAMAIGAAHSADLARRAGFAVGASLRVMGLTMNLAPVLDVLTDPRNAAIGTRAFGSDPRLVAEMGSAFIAGEQEAGVVAVGKHFPGQGGVAEDSHETLPELAVTMAQLRQRELQPFREAFAHGLMAVMTAHIALPGITGGGRPATLSPRVMTRLLRDEMKFRGIAITDALQMDALGRKRDPGALALEAVLAGSDMVLALGDEQQRVEVYHSLLAAYRDARLSAARTDEALRRILTVKGWLQARSANRSSRAPDQDVAAEISRQAVTVLESASPLIPLRAGARVVFVGPPGELQTSLNPSGSVSLPASGANVPVLVHEAVRVIRTGEVCVVAAANKAQFAVVESVHQAVPDVPMIFVNLGSPFRTLRGPRCANVLTYAEDAPSQRAAADVILGRATARGIAPVTLPR